MTDTQLLLEAMAAMEARIMDRFPKRKTPRKKAGEKKYGEYQKVKLTDAELADLLEEYGEARLSYGIKVLDEGIKAKGYKYTSHHFMLKNKWPRERMLEWKPPEEKRSLFGD